MTTRGHQWQMERDLKLSLEPELKPLARMRASLLPILGDNKKQVVRSSGMELEQGEKESEDFDSLGI